MNVKTEISDIFFNMDHFYAVDVDLNGNFEGYNDAVLTDSAEKLIDNLSRLNVQNLPTSKELVADFLTRV